MPIKASCGPDDIHPRILKHCSNSLASPLCALFNTSFKCGEIPDDWKIALLFRFTRKEPKTKLKTTDLFCFCEKVVRRSIVNFWTDHQVFIGEQFGFMKKAFLSIAVARYLLSIHGLKQEMTRIK